MHTFIIQLSRWHSKLFYLIYNQLISFWNFKLFLKITRFIKEFKILIMSTIFYSLYKYIYIYSLSFKLFSKIIKLINKFNKKCHLI